MSTQQLLREEWKEFFDSVSKHGELEKNEAEIEVLGLRLGEQIAAQWVPLYGMSYDTRSDTLEVDLKDHMHRIHHPERIYIDREGVVLSSVLAIDSDGLQHIVRLRVPLSLPKLKPLATR